MGSPDSEGTLEDDAPAQPGARAGEARDGDEEGLGKVARETCAEPVRTPERGVDPGGVADERIRSDDLGREERTVPFTYVIVWRQANGTWHIAVDIVSAAVPLPSAP